MLEKFDIMPRFASTLHLSSYFVMLQVFLLIGSLACISYLSCSVWLKFSLILIVCAYSVWILSHNRQWQSIGEDADGWYLIKKNGQKIPACWLGDSTVTSFVSILRFKVDGCFFRQSCLVFRDSMPDNLYRQLTVRLTYWPRAK